MNKALLASAGVLVAATSYVALRLQPLLRSRREAMSELAECRDELAGNPPPATPTEELAREVQALEVRRGALVDEVARQERGLAEGAALSGLSLRLSSLAADAGLRIQSREVVRPQAPRASRHVDDEDDDPARAAQAPVRAAAPPPPSGAPTPWNLEPFLVAAPHLRPIERWVARGTFPALRAFLARLDALGGPVILDVQVLRDGGDDAGSLEVRLTLAL